MSKICSHDDWRFGNSPKTEMCALFVGGEDSIADLLSRVRNKALYAIW